MKNIIQKILLLIIILPLICFSQDYWKKVLESAGKEFNYTVIELTDGNNALIGHGELPGSEKNKILVRIFDTNGDTVRTVVVEETDSKTVHHAIKLSDGSVLVTGEIYIDSTQDFDIWLMKLTADFEKAWEKIFGGSDFEKNPRLLELSDTTIALTANTASFGAGGFDIWLLKVTMDGDTLRTKTYGGIRSDNINDCIELSDSTLLIGGHVKVDTSDWSVMLVNTTLDGDSLWSKMYGGDKGEYNARLFELTNGEILMACETHSFGAGNRDLWLLKLTASGDTLWTNTFGGAGYEDIADITVNTSGYIYMIATTDSYGAGKEDIWLLKCTPTGDTVWTKTLGHPGVDYAVDFIELSDGNILLLGGIAPPDGLKYNAWLVLLFQDYYIAGDSLFNMKIPVSGNSVFYTYTPLEAPSDMKISSSGTVSWLPGTDSSYKEYVKILVTNTNSNNTDTATFNIMVNDTIVGTPIISGTKKHLSSPEVILKQNGTHSPVIIKVLSPNTTVDIFDIRGRKLQSLSFHSNKSQSQHLVWHGDTRMGSSVSSGQYFLRITSKEKTVVKPVFIIR